MIFARSADCSGVVSHAMHCVLIATSAVQHAETVLVGLAPRCQDANATRNIPHVESTTEVVIGSMWKRSLVHKLNTLALSSEILHGADVFLFTDFLSVHFFRSLPAPLSLLETVCFLILPPTQRTGWRCTEGCQFFVEEVSFSSAADPALVGSWRLPSGFSTLGRRPRATSMSRFQYSARV